MKLIFEITPEGNLHGLYTDDVNLFDIGRVTNVHKASNVEFNESKQCWQVLSLDGEVLYENTSREKAVEWEIEVFSPGGKHYGKGN
jgi:hypothetical protein